MYVYESMTGIVRYYLPMRRSLDVLCADKNPREV
uniref:Uncharacterized protein n=1 Tax=Manihot esculenta TaxID=3983 RepID=A0A2C9V5N8_MANES